MNSEVKIEDVKVAVVNKLLSGKFGKVCDIQRDDLQIDVSAGGMFFVCPASDDKDLLSITKAFMVELSKQDGYTPCYKDRPESAGMCVGLNSLLKCVNEL